MCTKIDTFNFFFLTPPLPFFYIILFLSQLFAVPVFLSLICLSQTNPNPKLRSSLSIFTCDYLKFSPNLLTSSPLTYTCYTLYLTLEKDQGCAVTSSSKFSGQGHVHSIFQVRCSASDTICRAYHYTGVYLNSCT